VLEGFNLVGYITLWVYGQNESSLAQKQAKYSVSLPMMFVSYLNEYDGFHYED
jgi:hypothetical protein